MFAYYTLYSNQGFIIKKHVEFTDLTDLLNRLGNNSSEYKTKILDNNTVLIGDVKIQCFYNIDPENISQQYKISTCDKEYILLPNKIWQRTASDKSNKATQMDYSPDETAKMYRKIQHINAITSYKNTNKFIYHRYIRPYLWCIILSGTASGITVYVIDAYKDKRQDKGQNTKEIPAVPKKPQINPIDTLRFPCINKIEK